MESSLEPKHCFSKENMDSVTITWVFEFLLGKSISQIKFIQGTKEEKIYSTNVDKLATLKTI